MLAAEMWGTWLVAAFQALNETLFSPGDPEPLITPVPA